MVSVSFRPSPIIGFSLWRYIMFLSDRYSLPQKSLFSSRSRGIAKPVRGSASCDGTAGCGNLNLLTRVWQWMGLWGPYFPKLFPLVWHIESPHTCTRSYTSQHTHTHARPHPRTSSSAWLFFSCWIKAGAARKLNCVNISMRTIAEHHRDISCTTAVRW